MHTQSKLLFVNYFEDDPKKTAESERGDFYVTGDRATMDEDGYFQFIGRDDDIIISSGSVYILPFLNLPLCNLTCCVPGEFLTQESCDKCIDLWA